MNSINMYGFNGYICSLEAYGLSKVFSAYADDCPAEYIQEIGFNSSSGYVFIALENGIQICSRLGQRVIYLITDFETGEETFFESYTQAEQKLEEINNQENQ